ncbi:putative UDP-glucose:glycoprotein, partial [Cardiosporidium cionae]
NFSNLQTNHTLTAAIFVPDGWLIRSAEVEIDLDNIRLMDVSSRLYSFSPILYDLTIIYIEGTIALDPHAFQKDLTAKNMALSVGLFSPRLLQMEAISVDLQKNLSETEKITLFLHPPALTKFYGGVCLNETPQMGNFGYFQLQAKPGNFEIRIISSPNSPNYQLSLTDGSSSSSESLISLSSHRRPTPSYLASYSPVTFLTSTWNYLSYLNPFTFVSRRDETIHIFSLASGHLYERLLRIMILSVRSHTNSPLHFWFVDNFLSLKFKKIMPHMAMKYKITYSYITYKWPSWLYPQTEKQRIIWAYKILFLDVMFPTSLKRVIYIDADQVWRERV